jgi:hypothetical protein
MALTPVDLKQCQAEKPTGNSFMTMGGVVGLERCTSKPAAIVVENKAGKDGQVGSMTVCFKCLEVFKKQLGPDYATVAIIQH